MSTFPTDIEIAQAADIKHIKTIAEKIGVAEEDLYYFGKHKAKLPLHLINADRVKQSKLILVTAINPTPAGEGKTTVSVGLTDGLNKTGKKAIAVLEAHQLSYFKPFSSLSRSSGSRVFFPNHILKK